ncbi:hypothetical protein GUITHDRAFT_162382 [Guillardia theta CCMP2712]|uniref:CHAT domain-containing protein n=1 Tax=Guillardia theta (strain CCMP2712) TaxID=905079 RepID=L1JK25_GUITC|nr:hypothetical protein GUITHDRAFT_162382 [Guillardia theta CCMP2712]EKX48504.1 hypothetical protein GUITHDRAFT_162382 [Guillardia theta CCMP2712]|eukprot:XP_005835484.1 hypothetical protein GUITHDRAFT_162382 [Guillardia theta CCMP2712]
MSAPSRKQNASSSIDAEDNALIASLQTMIQSQDHQTMASQKEKLLSLADKYAQVRPSLTAGILGNLGLAFQNLGLVEEAITLFERHLNVSEGMKDSFSVYTACGNLGNAYSDLCNFPEAIKYFEKAAECARVLGSKEAEANCLANLGISYRAIGEYERALEHHERSLKLSVESEDVAGECKARGNIGALLLAQGRSLEARPQLEKTLELGLVLQDETVLAKTYGNLATISMYLGQFDEAVVMFEKQIELAKSLGDATVEAVAYGNLGLTYSGMGKNMKAIELEHRYLEMSKALGNLALQSSAYSNLGSAYNSVGQYGKAVEMHEACLKISSELGLVNEECTAYSNLGTDYLSLGEYAKSWQMHKKCLDMCQRIGDKRSEGMTHGNLGKIAFLFGGRESAVDMFTKFLEMSKEVDNLEGEMIAALDLSYCDIVGGRAEQAISSLNQQLERCKSASMKDNEMGVYRNLGEAYSSLGRHDEAMKMFTEALGIAIELQDVSEESKLNGSIGHEMIHLKDYKGATRALLRGILRSELVEKDLGDRDSLRVSLFESLERSYSLLQTALILQSRQEEALAVASYGKARSLTAILEAKEMERLTAATQLHALNEDEEDETLVLRSLWEEYQQMVREEGIAVMEYYCGHDGEICAWSVSPEGELVCAHRWNTNALADKYKLKRMDMRTLLDIARVSLGVEGRDSMNNAGSCSQPEDEDEKMFMQEMLLLRQRPREEEIEDPAQVRNQLAGMEDAIVKSGDVVDVKARLLETEGLQSWIRSHVQCSEEEHAAVTTKMAEAVKTWLDLSKISKRRLKDITSLPEGGWMDSFCSQVKELFDEDSILRELYDVLVAPLSSSLHGRTEILLLPHKELFFVPWAALLDQQQNYLVQSFTLRVAPSLKTARMKSRGLLASSDGPKRICIVGDPHPNSVGPLPFALEEARELQARCGDKERFQEVVVVTGEEANKSAVVEAMRGSHWVHLACHGKLEKNSLVVSSRDERHEDLSMEEIQSASLGLAAGSSVVLSACNTGRGSVKGEGVIGIARGFLAAGASATLVSLWSIGDSSTKELMDRMYMSLEEGQDLAQALRIAMLSLARLDMVDRGADRGRVKSRAPEKKSARSWAGVLSRKETRVKGGFEGMTRFEEEAEEHKGIFPERPILVKKDERGVWSFDPDGPAAFEMARPVCLGGFRWGPSSEASHRGEIRLSPHPPLALALFQTSSSSSVLQ